MTKNVELESEDVLRARAVKLHGEILRELNQSGYSKFGVGRNGQDKVNRENLHKYVDQFVESTVAANRRKRGLKPQFIMLSGGSASEVGALVKAIEKFKVVNKKATLKLDSEAIIESGAVAYFGEIAAKGHKHPEKMTKDDIHLFHFLLIDAVDYYYRKLREHNVAGSVIIDDHCHQVEIPMIIAMETKKMGGEASYVCVARDPRNALECAATRVAKGGGAITTALLIETHKLQPRNWAVFSKCAKTFDLALLSDMNYVRTTVPEIAARRIGNGKIEVLNPVSLHRLNCVRKIPNSARTEAEMFPVDPFKLHRQGLKGEVFRKRGNDYTIFLEEALNPENLQKGDSFLTRITKDAVIANKGRVR